MTTVKMAPPRRRPRRVAKRIKKRRGAKTFAGGDELKRRWALLVARGAKHMVRACIAGVHLNLVDLTIHTEVGLALMAGKQHIADRLDRLGLMGYANPASTVAAMERAASRRRLGGSRSATRLSQA